MTHQDKTTLSSFLDRYIQGERGSYFYQIGPDYKLAAGQFYLKQHARDSLLRKLIAYLDGLNDD